MESQDQDAIIYRHRAMPGSFIERAAECSDISPIVYRRKTASAGMVSEQAADCSQSSPIVPIIIKRKPKVKAKVHMNENGRSSKSPPAVVVVKRKAKSQRQRMLKNKLLDLQCKEDKDGDSVTGSENSSDDNDQANLSNVSETADHSNAEHHVYLESLASQNKFPTPIQQRRFRDSGQMDLCGAQVVVFLLFQMYDDLATEKLEMDIRNRKAAKKKARLQAEAKATASASAAVSEVVSERKVSTKASLTSEPAETVATDVFSEAKATATVSVVVLEHEVSTKASLSSEPAETVVIDVFSDSGMIACTGR
jgi:hypothetical protein